MTNTITRDDVHRQVATALGASTVRIPVAHVDEITEEVVERFGLVDIDTIEHDAFWHLAVDVMERMPMH
jgi:hypothetical protein